MKYTTKVKLIKKTMTSHSSLDIMEIPTKRYLLTINADFTRFVQVYVLDHKTSKEITQNLFKFFQHFEVPKTVHCDQ